MVEDVDTLIDSESRSHLSEHPGLWDAIRDQSETAEE